MDRGDWWTHLWWWWALTAVAASVVAVLSRVTSNDLVVEVMNVGLTVDVVDVIVVEVVVTNVGLVNVMVVFVQLVKDRLVVVMVVAVVNSARGIVGAILLVVVELWLISILEVSCLRNWIHGSCLSWYWGH